MRFHYRFRWVELLLLVLAGGLTTAGFALLAADQTHHVARSDIVYPLVFAASTIVLSLWMGWAAPRSDQLVLPVVSALAGIGMLVVTRLSSSLGHRELAWVLLGELAAATLLVVPRHLTTLRHYKYTWAVIGMVLIVATIVLGTDVNGSGYRRWIGFHGLYVQPVELLKVLLAIFFAAYLDEKHELLSSARLEIGRFRLPGFQYLAPLVAVWGLSLLLLVKQNDLGSALLFLGIFLAMLYVGTSRPIYPVLGLVMFVTGAFLAFHLFPHVRDRTEIWLDPWTHASGQGYQLVQGLIALASGGIGGAGLGLGNPTIVPVVSTDFIIAAIGEELGLAGIVAILALLLFLVFRGLAVGLSAEDGFRKLLAVGLMATIAIQTIVIVGGTTRVMPLTGVPLPFLSYGGSSAVADYIMIGLLLKISAEAAEEAR